MRYIYIFKKKDLWVYFRKGKCYSEFLCSDRGRNCYGRIVVTLGLIEISVEAALQSYLYPLCHFVYCLCVHMQNVMRSSAAD